MKNIRAFTLIELLVVIAIIAILAAILFPVFAQAKAAAKGTQELSGVKQISLGTKIYLTDYDDQYPYALDNLWQHTWVTCVQPYTKSYPLFLSPFDGLQKLPAGDSWAGVVSDYSANAYITNWDNANGPTNFAHLRGLFCANAQPAPGANWIDLLSQNETAITQPASTIELAPKYQSQVIAAGAGFGNTTAFCGAAFMSFYSDAGVSADGFGGNWDWCSDMEMPNGGITVPGTKFPFTRTGAVGIGRANVANFSYADGHAHAMAPAATNPDGDNTPLLNQWDALR